MKKIILLSGILIAFISLKAQEKKISNIEMFMNTSGKTIICEPIYVFYHHIYVTLLFCKKF